MPPTTDEEKTGGRDRRSIPRHEIADMVSEEIAGQLADHESRLIQHINAKTLEVVSKIDVLLQAATLHTDREIKKVVDQAFPEGPLYRHRDFHDGRIKQAERDDKIKTDVYSWFIKGGMTLLGAMLLLGFVEWFKRELTK